MIVNGEHALFPRRPSLQEGAHHEIENKDFSIPDCVADVRAKNPD
jgi:hypothetical protein